MYHIGLHRAPVSHLRELERDPQRPDYATVTAPVLYQYARGNTNSALKKTIFWTGILLSHVPRLRRHRQYPQLVPSSATQAFVSPCVVLKVVTLV